jgi:hypothetical protein
MRWGGSIYIQQIYSGYNILIVRIKAQNRFLGPNVEYLKMSKIKKWAKDMFILKSKLTFFSSVKKH